MKQKNIILWERIIIALIFFFNPNIGIVDILPDFMGYILLVTALSKVAVIDDRISDAQALFTRLIYITALRFASLFAVFGIIPLSDQSMSILLFSFVFDVLELLTLIPAVIKLFDGIFYLAGRHDGEVAYVKAGRFSAKTITERAKNTIIVFAFAKAFFGTLPEFSSLTSSRGWDESAWGPMHLFTGLFRVLGMTVALVFGVIFLIKLMKYVLALKKDSIFWNNLNSVYDDAIASRTDYLARRSAVVAFGYFGVAAFFMLDFNLDGYNVIPDALAALCIIAGLLTIKKHITKWKLTAVICGVFAISSLIQVILEYVFASKCIIEAVDIDPETYDFYVMICVAAVVASIISVVVVYSLVRGPLAEIIHKYTGFSVTNHDTYNPAEKIKRLHEELTRKLSALIILSSCSARASIASKVLVTKAGFLWMIGFAVDVVYIILTVKFLAEIKTQIDYKYMLS